MKTPHLLFSHTLTLEQNTDAKATPHVEEFKALSSELQQHFSNLPSNF